MPDLLIDTDTASDDAVALILALRTPGITVRGITTVAGNVNLEQATRNALLVTELCGSDVPVHAGLAKPMLRQAEDATWFHGRDGLGDRGFAPTRRTASGGHAVDAIIELSHRHPGLTQVTLGPLSNLAAALLRDPSLAGRIGRCVIMGGNPCCVGNVTPAAEYNVWCDPEAAAIVFRSGLAIDLVGWQLSRDDRQPHCRAQLPLELLGAGIAAQAGEEVAVIERAGHPDRKRRGNRHQYGRVDTDWMHVRRAGRCLGLGGDPLEIVVEQQADRRHSHGRPIAKRTARKSALHQLLPVSSDGAGLQDLPRTGPVPAGGIKIGAEPVHQHIRLDPAVCDQRFGNTDHHFGVVGVRQFRHRRVCGSFPSPAEIAVNRLGRKAFKWRPQGVAKRRSEKAALKVIRQVNHCIVERASP